jgi:anti-anti-sigma factor
MNFRIELEGDVNLIHPVGDFDGSRDCEELQALMTEIVVSGCRKVVLSFALTRWINTCGVGKVVAAKFLFDQVDGRLVLCELNRRSFSVLNTLRLNEIFEIHETLPEAIEALKQDKLVVGS